MSKQLHQEMSEQEYYYRCEMPYVHFKQLEIEWEYKEYLKLNKNETR